MRDFISKNIESLKSDHSELVGLLQAQKKASPLKFAFRLDDGIFLDNITTHPELVEKYFKTVETWATELSQMNLKDDVELMQAFRKKLHTYGVDGKAPFSLNFFALQKYSNASFATIASNSGCCQHISSFERDIYKVMGKDAELIGCITQPKKLGRITATLMRAVDSHVICAIKGATVDTGTQKLNIKYLYSDSTNLHTFAKIKDSKILGTIHHTTLLPKRLLNAQSFGTMTSACENRTLFDYVSRDPGVSPEVAALVDSRFKEAERCFGEVTPKYHESLVPKKFRSQTIKYGADIYGPKPDPKFPLPTPEQAAANAENPLRLSIMDSNDVKRNNKALTLAKKRINTRLKVPKGTSKASCISIPPNTKTKPNISLA